MKSYAVLLLAVLCIGFSGCQSNREAERFQPYPRVKYVFLLIGDGYGPNQRLLTEAAIGRTLEMSKMTTYTPTGTNNAYGKTTDSAASGTAIACGVKTYNGAIGVDANRQPVQSLACKLRDKGFKIAMISSSPLTDATPAAHYSHQLSRGMTPEIGRDMANSGFDFFGGALVHKNETLKTLEKAGYTVLRGKQALSQTQPGVKYYVNQQPYTDWTMQPGRELPDYTLAGYLEKAIELLDNPVGFFIMLENGHIDYAGHGNDAGKTVREVVAFDEAVQVALKFQAARPDETLVIVTADHETGGLEIGSLVMDKMPLLLKQKDHKGAISARIGKLTANEPAARTNGKAMALLEEQFGYIFPEEDQKILAQRFDKGAPVIVAAAAALRDKALGFAYTTGGHSSQKIITNAQGPGAERFREPLENSDLPHLIASIMLPEAFTAEYRQERERRTALVAVREQFSQASDDLTVTVRPGLSRQTVLDGKTFELTVPDAERYAAFETGFDNGDYAVTVTNKHTIYPLCFTITPKAGFKGDNFYLYEPAAKALFLTRSGSEIWSRDDLAFFTQSCDPGGERTFLLLADKPAKPFTTESGMNIKFALIPVWEAKTVDRAPVIDGVRTDPVWKQANEYKMAGIDGKPLAHPATVRLLADKGRKVLYGMITVPDQDITAKFTGRDESLWEEDSVEMFFASADQQNYFQIVVNPNGAVYDQSKQLGQKWNAQMNLKIRRDETPGTWIAEFALPLEQFGLSGALEANFCRTDYPGKAMSNLSPTGGSFHSRDAFVPIDMVD